MYFASRMQAGRMLATQLSKKYRYENCAVLALNDGGAMVGAQIASELHCIMMLMLNSEITLPREPDAIAGITSNGSISYNRRYSEGEIDELVGEYHSLIEQEKLTSLHNLNHAVGNKSVLNKDLLKGHNVIVVADGLKNGFLLDLTAEFLKPIAIDKLIVATPFASVQAVDRMHIVADELYCLSVIEDYISTDHYYDTQDVPSHEAVIQTVEKIVLQWK